LKKAALFQTVTLRLPADLCHQATELARQRNQSISALLNEDIQRLLKENSDRALSDAFDLLSEFSDECNVDYAFSVQAEAVLRDEACNPSLSW